MTDQLPSSYFRATKRFVVTTDDHLISPGGYHPSDLVWVRPGIYFQADTRKEAIDILKHLKIGSAKMFDMRDFDRGGDHLYRIEVRKGDHRETIEIDAHNRTQAAAKARKMGWEEVCWVNMIG